MKVEITGYHKVPFRITKDELLAHRDYVPDPEREAGVCAVFGLPSPKRTRMEIKRMEEELMSMPSLGKRK